MKSWSKSLLGLLTLIIGYLMVGCTSQKETSIPWSRPANWEGQVPGMGATPGQGR